MKKCDKWVVLRCSVDEMRELENAIYERYTRNFQNGFSIKAKKLLKIYFKIRKQLEIEDD